jgi:hypothetical protein
LPAKPQRHPAKADVTKILLVFGITLKALHGNILTLCSGTENINKKWVT